MSLSPASRLLRYDVQLHMSGRTLVPRMEAMASGGWVRYEDAKRLLDRAIPSCACCGDWITIPDCPTAFEIGKESGWVCGPACYSKLTRGGEEGGA